MKLLALSALICAVMALTLAADAAEPEPQPEAESEPKEAKEETAAVEKRFFDWGSTHNQNSHNTDNRQNYGNTDNRLIGNKGHFNLGTNNRGIHFGHTRGWSSVEKRFFNWGNTHNHNSHNTDNRQNYGNTDNRLIGNKGHFNLGTNNRGIHFGHTRGWSSVEKRFFNWGNTHNHNSHNTDNRQNYGNTDNRLIGNEGDFHVGHGNSNIHFGHSQLSRAVEKRIFCRPWRHWTKIGSRHFLYNPDRLTWNKAECKCRRLGGHLASVHSAWEYQRIRHLIKRHSGHHPQAWIGGNDKQCEGHWKWTDGSCFNYKGWCPGEPNNAGSQGSQNCLQMNYSSRKCWDDLGCHHKLPSVCVRNRRW